MNSALVATGLGKRYGRRRWALKDCSLEVPIGHVVGLVGPNGAGKTTLLHLAVGLLSPTVGRISVLGESPADSAELLSRVGFVAQDAPVYGSLSVADHLHLGAHLNPSWDAEWAKGRVADVGIELAQKAGQLSGGQRAQLALTIALAKRPELLLLDEPVAGLDPLARREFLQMLMVSVVEQGVSVVMSSHLVADLERVCDYLIVLVDAQVELSGEVEKLCATHRRLVGARRDRGSVPEDWRVVEASHTDRQTTLLVQTESPIHDPAWTVEDVGLEDLVLAYMRQRTHTAWDRPLELRVQR